MDEEMIMLDNIMPLELAIKRELEYRRKMEASQKQHKRTSSKSSRNKEKGTSYQHSKASCQPCLQGLSVGLHYYVSSQAALCKSNTQRQFTTVKSKGRGFKQPTVL
uniref:Putative Zinc finger, C2H2 n=1 Tax=Davidia involucrata TaxID=16924 RepID=A0A5B7ASN2_DAVIN